jgi:hypothetical protein
MVAVEEQVKVSYHAWESAVRRLDETAASFKSYQYTLLEKNGTRVRETSEMYVCQ